MTNKKTVITKLNEYKNEVGKMNIEQYLKQVSFFAQKKEKECYDNGGHKPKKGVGYKSISFEDGKMKVYEFCERCNMPYRREPTLEERKEFSDMMKISFDI